MGFWGENIPGVWPPAGELRPPCGRDRHCEGCQGVVPVWLLEAGGGGRRGQAWLGGP